MKTNTEALHSALYYFYEWERQMPDAVFLRQPSGNEWLDITWAQAGKQARQIAAALLDMGLKPGDNIGLVSKNCYHWIIADLAIMMGGFVSVPFYPTLNADQLAEVIALGDIKLLFVGKLDDWTGMRNGVPVAMPIIRFPHYTDNAVVNEGVEWNELLEKYEPLEGNPTPDVNDLWTILFTSGTTGTPKGVMLRYITLEYLLSNERRHNALKLFGYDEYRYFSYLPLNHIAERIIVEAACIATGGSISFAENLASFAQNLKDTRPNVFLAVPRIWTKFQMGILARMPQKKLDLLLRIPIVNNLVRKKIKAGLGLDKARIMLTGAAPAPDALKNWFLKLGIAVQEVYAMTENCGGCTLMPAERIKPGTVGKPLPGVNLKIDPENGEILMQAPWVMAGYYNDEAKTAAVIRNGWLHTGDQGEIDKEGFLRITGRVSDTFKSSKGKYIVPGPIEWGLAKNNFIEQVCVVGLALPQPVALVVLSEVGKACPQQEVSESLQASLNELNAVLPNYERLNALVVVKENWSVENGVLTPTLKIKRNVVNDHYEQKCLKWAESTEAVIWEE